jgi:hypothetical protein
MYWFGNKKYEKHGGGCIPCKDCGKPFYSYPHFGYYDDRCEWCSFARRDPKYVKHAIQQILLLYQNGETDWEETKLNLSTEGIKI